MKEKKNPNGKLTISEIRKKGIANNDLKLELGEVCCYCGCTNRLALTIDHKTPLTRGGKDIKSNKQVACMVCNWLKGGLKHEEYLEYQKALNTLKDLNKVKLNFGTMSLYLGSYAHPKTLAYVEKAEEDSLKNRAKQLKENEENRKV